MNKQKKIPLRNGQLIIDLGQMKKNIDCYRGYMEKETKLMAVVKANGYGHGAIAMAKAAIEAGATYLAVSTLGEAMELREAGIQAPILILTMIYPEYIAEAIAWDCTLTVSDDSALQAIQQCAKQQGKCAKIHTKINTGMNRIGFCDHGAWRSFLDEITEMDAIHWEGMFTHFADADSEKADRTEKQATQFETYLAMVSSEQRAKLTIHACNSAGIIAYPAYHYDMVRLGLGMYGYPLHPVAGIEPIMQWETNVVFVHDVQAGDVIGYNGTYKAEKDMRVAVVPVGYADGYSRTLSNCGQVIINGKKLPIVGRICMDQFMVDISEEPNISLGDRVILLGKTDALRIDANDIAAESQTIAHEVLAKINARVPKVYKA